MSENLTNKAPASAESLIRLGLGVIAVTFGGLALWSSVAPIEGAVVAPGQIVVESSRKTVQHLEGGVLDEILVREGEMVQAGAVVARLDSTVPKSNADLIDGQLTELYAKRARLEAERNGLEDLEAPRGDASILQSREFSEKMAGQRELFNARSTSRNTQVALLEERIVQQQERIVGFNTQIKALEDQKKLIEDELAGVRALNAEGYAPMTRLRALEREAKRLAGESGALRASVAEATSIIVETKLEIDRIGESAREDAINELRDVEVAIAGLQERRVAAYDILRRTEIRAPQTGRVLGLSVHTEGGVIASGAPLMEIVPEDDLLQVAAHLSPRDVDKVRKGQDTLIRFSALRSRRTPEAEGVVHEVSADAMSDKRTGEMFYLVLVDIPQGEALDSALRGERLVPGMPVEVFIRTGEQSAISYLLKPLSDSLAKSMREN